MRYLPQLGTDLPGITWSFHGGQAQLHESSRSLVAGCVLALVAVYALLAVAFASYGQPRIVMMAIPFGIVGGVIGHIVLG